MASASTMIFRSVAREPTRRRSKRFSWRCKRDFGIRPTPRCSTEPIPRAVQFFDDMMELGVEGMMLSPGYTYDKTPDQEHFLSKKKTRDLFRQILSNRHEKWRFNLSPLFMEMLMGKREYKCTPWGMPTYNI